MTDQDFEAIVFADSERWENREIGAEMAYAKKTNQTGARRAALNGTGRDKTQLISIRLPITLIEDLKLIGQAEGVGYQTLAKLVLQRFADAEHRKKFNQVVAEKLRLEAELAAMRSQMAQLKQA
ncbi:hypothetical protein [Moraxella atlantae]|uniref:Uncharacterized protein conserved in bacteria n=1 Tax=Faucicola atlantae TaxID=34059 RepID=A0A378Q7L0_9GAMM|nr:hypothetical protein [Moraxella atlantae]STY95207.1 Uncharacterized protein conserved in bacteria [Moraxella atlantae]